MFVIRPFLFFRKFFRQPEYTVRPLAVCLAAATWTAAAPARADGSAAVPEQITAQYSSSFGIPAHMEFKRSGSEYTVVTRLEIPLLYSMRFESGGSISGSSLKPRYYQDVRNGKIYAMAVFADGKAAYGRPGGIRTEAVPGEVMDLFTLAWQLAFNGGKLPEKLKITNGKKLYDAGSLHPAGSREADIGGRHTELKLFEISKDNGTVRFAFAFAPALHNLPAFIDYTDGGNRYQLILQAASANGRTLTAHTAAPQLATVRIRSHRP